MRVTSALLMLLALGLSGCGGDAPPQKTVVVVPPGQAQVAPPGRVTKVCPQGATTC